MRNTNRTKAMRLLAKLALMHRPATYLTVEDIRYNCSTEELDFYYFWICKGGRK